MKAEILEVGKMPYKDDNGNTVIYGWSWDCSNIPVGYVYKKDTVFGWTLQELEEMSKDKE